jgi:hypothetical protein
MTGSKSNRQYLISSRAFCADIEAFACAAAQLQGTSPKFLRWAAGSELVNEVAIVNADDLHG